jgi:protein-S-isoprenylcysteine O-methyltransferase Ste14
MLGQTGWIALGIMALYLAFFAWGTMEAARVAKRPVWLFGRTRGIEWVAALGFRLAFVLALLGPLLWLAFPMLHKLHPLWTETRHNITRIAGLLLAVTGAMLSFAAQMSMGASWRVGVLKGESGVLVTDGLFRLSRNPTFVGQGLLLAGLALAVPSLPTLLAVLLFAASASMQVRTEEQVLLAAHGAEYRRWSAEVPRWISLGSRLRPRAHRKTRPDKAVNQQNGA